MQIRKVKNSLNSFYFFKGWSKGICVRSACSVIGLCGAQRDSLNFD